MAIAFFIVQACLMFLFGMSMPLRGSMIPKFQTYVGAAIFGLAIAAFPVLGWKLGLWFLGFIVVIGMWILAPVGIFISKVLFRPPQ